MKRRRPPDYRELLRTGRWFAALPDELQAELLDVAAIRTATASIRVGAIVEVEDADTGEGRTFFLAPVGAGQAPPMYAVLPGARIATHAELDPVHRADPWPELSGWLRSRVA